MSEEMIFEEAKDSPPRYIKIIENTPEKAVIALTKSGLFGSLAYIALFVIAFFGGIILGGLVGYANNSIVLGLLVGCGAIAGGIWVAKKASTTTMNITVTPEAVSLLGKNYRRSEWGGFRGTKPRTTGHPDMSEANLIFRYGGEDKPVGAIYEADHLVFIVNALNKIVDAVKPPEPQSAVVPEKGERPARF